MYSEIIKMNELDDKIKIIKIKDKVRPGLSGLILKNCISLEIFEKNHVINTIGGPTYFKSLNIPVIMLRAIVRSSEIIKIVDDFGIINTHNFGRDSIDDNNFIHIDADIPGNSKLIDFQVVDAMDKESAELLFELETSI